MGVQDGQPVNAAYTNPAFLDRRIDDTALGNITLSNTDPASGSSVTNVQKELNSDASFTGKALNSAADVKPTYTNNDVGSVGQTLLARADSLTQRFNSSSGHTHDGTTGNGPKVSSANLANVPLRGYVVQGTQITGATGSSTDISALMTGKTAGGGPSQIGVVTSGAYNKVVLRYGSGANTGDEIVDGSGNVVYGRVTYSASVWTLSYYVLLSATETAYSFGSATNLDWYYQEIYNPMVSVPTYSEFAVIPSDNTTADVVTATSSVQGKTLLASATPSAVDSSGAVGTQNGTVANADHAHAGLHSLAKSGSSQILGDATLTGSNGVTLTQVSSNIDISAPALSSATPSAIASTGSVGTGTTSSRADHTHEGVHSVAKSGSSQITGDVTLTGSGGTTLTQSSSNIQIASPALSSSAAADVASTGGSGSSSDSARADHTHRGVASVAKTGSSQLFGSVTFSEGTNITLTQVGNDISITAAGIGGALSDATPQAVGSAGSAGTGLKASREDHVHPGLHSIAKSGSSQILGDATLTGSNGISLTQSSNNIDVSGAALLPLAGGTMTGNITLTTGYGLDTLAGLPAGALLNIQRFTSGTSATYTPTVGTRMIAIELCGGGGGGGGSASTTGNLLSATGGGGGGGAWFALFKGVSGTTGTYTIGSGGSAGSNSGGNGGTGGNSTFVFDGLTLTANGGAGGTGENAPPAGAPGANSNSGGGKGATSSSGSSSNLIMSYSMSRGSAGGSGAVVQPVSGSTYSFGSAGAGGSGGGSFAGAGTVPGTKAGTSTQSISATSGSLGAGGTGVLWVNVSGGTTGGAGGGGYLMIWEYA